MERLQHSDSILELLDRWHHLAGIYLVDEQEPQAGNLWVWPGSHLDHQRLFQERGVRALEAVSGHSRTSSATRL